ncbi:MAG: MBL fold metallo-hydrolase [Oceanospirillaceae bacterium]|nr:MBL fold metallo-hydrolase [Oceanospirillaceae bacterium]
MKAQITVLSGYGKKSPAAILLEYKGIKLLLDAGGSLEYGQDKGWDFPKDLDAIIISHDHIDHCAALSTLESDVAIYATAEVQSFLPKHLSYLPLPINGTLHIAGICVTTGLAGHSLGGVWVHLDVGEGVFYSGDFSLESQLFPFISPPKAGIALVDASYGLHTQSLAEQKSRILQVLNNYQKILLPVPGSGRALEIAIWLNSLGINDWRLGTDCLNPHDALQLARELFQIKASAHLETMPNRAYSDRAAIIISGDADGQKGEIGRIKKQQELPFITLYTGFMNAQARAELQGNKALFVRWNVHPRIQDIHWLIELLECRVCLPLFCEINNPEQWLAVLQPCLSFNTEIPINE